MKWRVLPSKLSGSITIPPSKSHTIRALLIATLAEGVSHIYRPLLSGDGASALKAARTLGALTDYSNDILSITGIGDNIDGGGDIFDLGNSGTGTNLFTSAAALGTRTRKFDGDSSLRSRPFHPLLEALVPLGATYKHEREKGDLPYTINGPLTGGKTTVNGVSSQFLSSLLFACPLIKNGNSEITVDNLQERPYIALSLWWLEKQGITVEYDDNYSHFIIPGNQRYTAFDMTVPSDFSSATFAAVAAAICGGPITLKGLDFTDPQGDKEIFAILEECGVTINYSSETVTVTAMKESSNHTIDLNRMPDALPAVAVLACVLEGETRIVNVAHARIKETDRIVVMCEELTKMGAHITETPDGLIVKKSSLTGTIVNGHDDHRVVMALALAGCIAQGETLITTAEAAEVTYPTYIEDFSAIGAHIKKE